MPIKDVIVLGAGMVGSVIAADLCKSGFIVTVADISEESLKLAKLRSGDVVKTVQADLANADKLVEVVKPFELMVNAVPGFMGLQTIKTVLERDACKKVCDISFMPEDALADETGLKKLAEEKGATVIVDCGVAPGISHMLIGNGQSLMSKIKKAIIYVGGLPHVRTKPFEYKAGFSPIDVIEEYTRPCYIISHGKEVCVPAMSGIEPYDFPGVGTLEAFYTDGLRSLTKTIKADFLSEKTFRYPGIPDQIKTFSYAGFFNSEPVTVRDAETGKEVKVRPVDVTSKLLFPKWRYAEGEADITIMHTEVTGISKKTGEQITEIWHMSDILDPKTNFPSMSRTTGFPCAIATRMIADETITKVGLMVPEEIGMAQNLWERVVKELNERGVKVECTQSEIKY